MLFLLSFTQIQNFMLLILSYAISIWSTSLFCVRRYFWHLTKLTSSWFHVGKTSFLANFERFLLEHRMFHHWVTSARSHPFVWENWKCISMSSSRPIKKKLPINWRSAEPRSLQLDMPACWASWTFWWRHWDGIPGGAARVFVLDCISTLIILPFLFHFLKVRVGLWEVVKLQPHAGLDSSPLPVHGIKWHLL